MQHKTSLKRISFRHTLWYVGLCLLLASTVSLGAFFASTPRVATAATSSTMNFQARLLQSSGALVPDGYYNVQFKLYNAATSAPGTEEWTETYSQANRVRVANGYLTVNLGALTAFGSNINWDQEHWLTMNIGGTTNTPTPAWDGEMTPRLKLTAVPYAFTAGKLQHASGSTLSFANQTASRNILLPDESGTVCIQGSTNCGFVAGSAANFIQNGTSPQTANFNVTGNGVVGGALGVGGNLTLTGSNAAIINRSASANSNAILVARVSTDSQDKFRIEANGRMYWGNGTDALDTTLYRIGVNTLQTDGSFISGGTMYAGGAGISLTGASGSVLKSYSTSGTVNQNDVVVLVNSSGAKVATSTTPKDTRIVGVYRGGSGSASGSVAIGGDSPVNVTAGAVSVGDQLVVSSEAGRATVDNNATSGILGYAVSSKAAGSVGSVTVRLAVVNGNTNPYYQVNDYRIQNAAGTTDLLRVDGTNNRLAVGPAAVPANGVLTIGTNTADATGGLWFGTDTNIFRSSANTLQTSGGLIVGGSGGCGNIKLCVSTSLVGARINVTSGSSDSLQLQNNGVNAASFSYDGKLKVAEATTYTGALNIGTNSSTSSSGGIYFGTDTNLYRSGANALATDDSFSLLGSGSNLTVQGTGTSSFAGNVSAADLNASTGSIRTGGTARITNSGNLINIGSISATGNINTSGDLQTGGVSRLTSTGQLQNINQATLRAQSGQTADILFARDFDNETDFRIKADATLSVNHLGSSNKVVISTSNSPGANYNTFEVTAGGRLKFGPGVGGATDTSLYRSDANALKTDGTFDATAYKVNGTDGMSTTCTSGEVLQNQVVVGGLVTGGTCATISTGASTLQDAYIGGNAITTTDARDVQFLLADTATDSNLVVNIASGSTGQFKVQSNGTDVMTMGATGQLALGVQGPSGGIVIGGDANLYRNAAGLLRTTGSFAAEGNVYSGHGTANQIRLNNNGQIQFGSAQDTNLYRSAANELRTDGDFRAGSSIVAYTGGANQVSLGRTASGTPGAGITFGSAGDTNLYRSSANLLATDDSFSILGGTSQLYVQGTGTSVFEGNLTVNGTINVRDFNRVQASALLNTYYTSMPNALTQSPMSRSWHDIFAFNRLNGTPTFEQSPDGSTWNAATLSSHVFAQTENTNIGILDGSTNVAARYTWNSSNLQYATNTWGWLVAKMPYTSATAATKTILVESSADGVTWTSRANVSGITSQQQAVYLPVQSWGSHTRIRVTITSTNGQPIVLSGLQMLTDRVASQGGGREYEIPYAWDANMNLITQGSGGATGVLRIGATNTTTADKGIYFSNDTNLYRSGTNALATDDSFSLFGAGSNLTVQGTGTSTFAGNLTVSGTITGNGSGLTNLNAANLTGTINDARLSTNVALKNTNNNFSTSQTVSGTVTATNFSGNGSGLTNLNASNVSSGTLNDARLSSNVVLLNRDNQTFTGSGQIFKNGTNSTSALAVQNATGDTLFNADTTNQRINIGTATSSAKLTISGDFNDASAWTSRTAAEANSWVAVAYGNGLFVAVAQDGTNRVMTSPDGITWTARAAAEANSWQSVAYGNGLFVAVSYNGTNRVMTSPDGITWTARAAAEANLWRSVTYGNGLFVAVALDGTNRVMTSPDGITWTARAAAETHPWSSIAYGNGVFVATTYDGSSNQVMTSPDGITWTARAVSGTNQWQSVTYGNGQFVAVAEYSDQVMTSSDGITWTLHTAHTGRWFSITYGNGLFVALAYTWANQVMTSPDGITWTLQTPATTDSWFGVAYGNGQFVAVATSGTNRVMTSLVGYGNAMNVLGDMDVAGTIRSNGYEVCTTAGNCGDNAANVLQGGNSFGATMALGTTDNFDLQFKTNGTTRFTISNTGNATFTGTITVGNSTNGVNISAATGVTYNGTARKTKKMVLTAEYAGAVLDGTGVGTLTAGHDGTRRENYYKWTAIAGTMQEYDIILTMPVPSDWSGWASSNALSVNTYTNGAANAGNNITVIGTTGVTDVNLGAATPASGWATYNFNLTDVRYTADGMMTIKVRVGAQNSGITQVGNITLTYLSKF